MSDQIPPEAASFYVAELAQQLALIAEASGLTAAAALLRAAQREAELAWILAPDSPPNA